MGRQQGPVVSRLQWRRQRHQLQQGLICTVSTAAVADVGCGDFVCGPLIYDTNNGVTVHGYDAYAAVIHANKTRFPQHKFTHIDVFVDRAQIEGADLCILKDVLQHWLIPDIYTFLNDIVTSGKFKHILVCNCCGQTKDDPDNRELSTGLSCDFLPLKRYGATRLFKYGTKEVSLINVNKQRVEFANSVGVVGAASVNEPVLSEISRDVVERCATHIE